jgi:hypothetical protein
MRQRASNDKEEVGEAVSVLQRQAGREPEAPSAVCKQGVTDSGRHGAEILHLT